MLAEKGISRVLGIVGSRPHFIAQSAGCVGLTALDMIGTHNFLNLPCFVTTSNKIFCPIEGSPNAASLMSQHGFEGWILIYGLLTLIPLSAAFATRIFANGVKKYDSPFIANLLNSSASLGLATRNILALAVVTNNLTLIATHSMH